MLIKSSRAFSPKNFVRKNSSDDLQDLFLEFNLPALDLENLENDFAQKYNECPDEIKESFQLIYDASTDKAIPLLIRTARDLGIYYQDLTAYELAIKIFLQDKQAFFNVLNWHNINSLKSVRDFQGNAPKEPNHKNIDAFEKELSTFFGEQGKGDFIKTDKYLEENKIAYVINHGEHAKRINCFQDKELKTIKIRLANAIVLVYYPKLSRFRVKCSDFASLDNVKKLFSKHLVEDDKFFDEYKNKSFFDLSKLLTMKKEDFKFNPADGIVEMEITRIDGYLTEDKIVKKSLWGKNGLLQQVEDLGEDLEKIKPYKVHLKFIFAEGKNNTRTIVITEPNQSNLNDSVKDNIIKKYFKEWEVMSA